MNSNKDVLGKGAFGFKIVISEKEKKQNFEENGKKFGEEIKEEIQWKTRLSED